MKSERWLQEKPENCLLMDTKPNRINRSSCRLPFWFLSVSSARVVLGLKQFMQSADKCFVVFVSRWLKWTYKVYVSAISFAAFAAADCSFRLRFSPFLRFVTLQSSVSQLFCLVAYLRGFFCIFSKKYTILHTCITHRLRNTALEWKKLNHFLFPTPALTWAIILQSLNIFFTMTHRWFEFIFDGLKQGERIKRSQSDARKRSKV